MYSLMSRHTQPGNVRAASRLAKKLRLGLELELGFIDQHSFELLELEK
jgi:hypothetical protein